MLWSIRPHRHDGGGAVGGRRQYGELQSDEAHGGRADDMAGQQQASTAEAEARAAGAEQAQARRHRLHDRSLLGADPPAGRRRRGRRDERGTVWRRSRPLPVAVVGVAVMIGSFELGVVPQSWTFAYVMVLAYACGAHARGWESPAGLAVALVGSQAIARFAVDAAPLGAADYVFAGVVLGGPWLAGRAIRRRGRQATADRRAAVVAERARIAGELHDVIAHSLSVVAIQSDAAEQALIRDPRLAQEPLRAIRRTSQEALAEMRRLVTILRVDDDAGPQPPQPGLAQLDDLVESVRAAGMPVALEQDGDPGVLGPGVNLAAYRIVQEA